MRIGELLIRDGHLTQDALEEALDWQVLYGGRLGTNLLELRLVPEEQLARALGKQLGCEIAWGDLQVDPALLPLIPNHVADRQELVPWKMERRRLKLLVTEIHPEKIDELAYKLGRPVAPVVAPEFRVVALLRAHYKATRQMRALDFGVAVEEGRRRRKKGSSAGPAEPTPELIDEAEFNEIYNRVLEGRGLAPNLGASAAAKQDRAPAAGAAPAPTTKAAAAVANPSGGSAAPSSPGIAKPVAPPPAAALPSDTPAPPTVSAAGAPPVPPASAAAAPPVPSASAAGAPPVPPASAGAAPPAARPAASPGTATSPRAPSAPVALEHLPEDAILGEVPSAPPVRAAEAPPAATSVWEEPPAPAPAIQDTPIDFREALQLLSGVRDRDAIAHIVLRASRSKAQRALLLQVQGGVALGWDGLGEGLENGAARNVAVPLVAPGAFHLVVNTRSHFMGPLHKTPINVRFLAQLGKKVPLSSLLLPILVRGRVSHLLYLDNGHKRQAPTDVGEMLILSQRIAQSVEALVDRRRAARG